jgi:5-amino-6-(5-phosphoribosylamino)uracil reductase
VKWHAQFEEYSARKTQTALDAALSPYRTGVDRHDDSLVSIRNDWTATFFDGAFYLSPPTRPHQSVCSLVFVQSSDGNTGATDPSSLGGGETDKHLIYEGLSRVAADAVFGGAETIRGGHVVLSVWHPELVRLRASLGKPRHPVQIVATLRGLDFDDGLLYNTPEIQVILITIGGCAQLMQPELTSRPWITTIVMDGPADLPRAFEQLRARGIERVSAIGGRRLATQLIDAGIIQDVYLTTAARPGGEPNTPMYPKPLPGDLVVRKLGTGIEAGVVFEHFRL